MNPGCQWELFQNDASIGEMAHIVPKAVGGDESSENLILLCCNCHKEVDDNRTGSTETTLREWKRQRNHKIQQQFTMQFESFEQWSEAVLPLLKRNGQIFESYGPAYDPLSSSEMHELWLEFENEIISNNERLGLLLDNNRHLLHRENQEIVDDFLKHAREFVTTRDAGPMLRKNLFPTKLLSVFGLETVNESLPPNVSALQNFVSRLLDEERFVELELFPCQVLIYRVQDRNLSTDLTDRPRVQQILYNARCFRPHTTNLRLGNLVFLLGWLEKNGISYEIPDFRDLTRINLNRKYKIKLCYEYILSRSVLQDIRIECGLIVVNLHIWNNAPVTADAIGYATEVGMKTLSQNEFFIFAHNNIK